MCKDTLTGLPDELDEETKECLLGFPPEKLGGWMVDGKYGVVSPKRLNFKSRNCLSFAVLALR